MKKTKSVFTLADINWLIDSMKLVFPTRDETVNKIDAMNIKLDKFIGDIQAKRVEQTLHLGKHEEIEERVSKIEKHLHFPVAP